MNLARLTAQAHAQRVEAARQLLIALASHPAMGGGDHDACNRLALGLTAQYAGIYATIGRADATGLVDCLALEGAAPGMSIADRGYFQRAKSTAAFVAGDFMHGKIRRQPTLAFAFPLVNPDGAVSHVIFANADLTVLSRGLETDTRMAGTIISLLDRNGTVIARSADADRFLGVSASRDQVRLMKERGETISSFQGPDGVRRTYAIAAVRDPDGELTAFATVGVPASTAALLEPGGGREWLAVALLAVGLLVAAWIGSELLIRRPIAKLVTATGALAAGDLRVRTPPVGGVRELEGLASAFNQMAIKLQERDLHLREGQRLEAVGQLAGGIAHDFNNLLTVIMGYAETLRESVNNASPEAAQLDELRAASQRAAQLTQQLLAFSRRQMLQPTPLQLNDVVGDMVSLLNRVTGGHVVIEVRSDPALGWVHADRVQMEQVVLNLVINARDAMPSGGRIVIETRNLVEAGAALVELSVSDTGVGMDAETRARIFEPFFTTKGLRGTGLGLATVYGIVKQSGGDVVCESESGEGTRFRVHLPRHAAGAVREPARPAQPVGGSESILLVDDDAGVRAVLETMLGRRGYVVRSAANAAEALRWFQEGLRPELVLTDVRMPGINGTSLAIKLKDYDPAPRIILMSGDAAPAMAGQADLGSAVFLQKPVTAPVLLRAVRDLLDQAG